MRSVMCSRVGWTLAALLVAGPASGADEALRVDRHHRPAPEVGAVPTVLAAGLVGASQLVWFEGAYWVRTSDGALQRYVDGGSLEPVVGVTLSSPARLVSDGTHLLLEGEGAVSLWNGSGFGSLVTGREGLRATHVKDGRLYWVEAAAGGSLYEAAIEAPNPEVRATGLGEVASLLRQQGATLIAPAGDEPRGFMRLLDSESAPTWVAESRLSAHEMLAVGSDVWAIMMTSRGWIERLGGDDVLVRVCYAQSGSQGLQSQGDDLFWFGPAGVWRLEMSGSRPEAVVTNTQPVGLVVTSDRVVWLDAPRGQLLSLGHEDLPTSAVP